MDKICMLVLVLLFNGLVVSSSAVNMSVLLIHSMYPSHFFPLVSLGEELLRRGHRVASLGVSIEGYEHIPRLITSSGIQFINCANISKDIFMDYIHSTQFDGASGSVIELVYNISEFASRLNNATHEDYLITMRKTIDTLNGSHYDYLIGEHEVVGLLHYASKKWKNKKIMLVPLILGLIPRYVVSWPFPKLLSPYTDSMTLHQRFMNTVVYDIFERIALKIYTSVLLPEKVQFDSSSYANDILTNLIAFPTLYNTIIGLEWTHSVLPLQHYVGPMLPLASQPLHPSLVEWLQMAPGHPLIYIGMGTTVVMTEETATLFLPLSEGYRIVWSMVYENNFLSEFRVNKRSVYISSWISQLAMLEHPDMKLAILHCGLNGVQEALYNAVPIICIPYGADQHDVAFRISAKKLGLVILPKELTSERLLEAVNEILHNKSSKIKENVMKISKLYRAAGGTKRGADLVELYADVGYDHGIPSFLRDDYSFVEYYNIDVWMIVGSILGIILFILYKAFRYCLCCCQQKIKQD
jgi:glucuronosyltransferase